jgi:hypothetical protein
MGYKSESEPYRCDRETPSFVFTVGMNFTLPPICRFEDDHSVGLFAVAPEGLHEPRIRLMENPAASRRVVRIVEPQ